MIDQLDGAGWRWGTCAGFAALLGLCLVRLAAGQESRRPLVWVADFGRLEAEVAKVSRALAPLGVRSGGIVEQGVASDLAYGELFFIDPFDDGALPPGLALQRLDEALGGLTGRFPGHDPPVLIGHGYGALVVAKYVAEWPGKCSGALLVAGPLSARPATTALDLDRVLRIGQLDSPLAGAWEQFVDRRGDQLRQVVAGMENSEMAAPRAVLAWVTRQWGRSKSELEYLAAMEELYAATVSGACGVDQRVLPVVSLAGEESVADFAVRLLREAAAVLAGAVGEASDQAPSWPPAGNGMLTFAGQLCSGPDGTPLGGRVFGQGSLEAENAATLDDLSGVRAALESLGWNVWKADLGDAAFRISAPADMGEKSLERLVGHLASALDPSSTVRWTGEAAEDPSPSVRLTEFLEVRSSSAWGRGYPVSAAPHKETANSPAIDLALGAIAPGEELSAVAEAFADHGILTVVDHFVGSTIGRREFAVEVDSTARQLVVLATGRFGSAKVTLGKERRQPSRVIGLPDGSVSLSWLMGSPPPGNALLELEVGGSYEVYVLVESAIHPRLRLESESLAAGSPLRVVLDLPDSELAWHEARFSLDELPRSEQPLSFRVPGGYMAVWSSLSQPGRHRLTARLSGRTHSGTPVTRTVQRSLSVTGRAVRSGVLPAAPEMPPAVPPEPLERAELATVEIQTIEDEVAWFASEQLSVLEPLDQLRVVVALAEDPLTYGVGRLHLRPGRLSILVFDRDKPLLRRVQGPLQVRLYDQEDYLWNLTFVWQVLSLGEGAS